jgi:protein-tyrosine phosphatase
MAEFIFKDLIKSIDSDINFVVSSSATSTEEIWNGIGNPVYPPAKRELAKHGISCEGKRAVQLKSADYENYDYFIGMDTMNIRNMNRILNDKDGKIYKLMSFTGDTKDVADPWYSGDFETTYNDIYNGCKSFLDFILN